MHADKVRLPDFIILGAEKAGTTWLGKRLNEQSGIFLSHPLELHYFDHEENYSRGAGWYATHFKDAGAGELVGEKTPGYLWAVRPADAGPHDIPERIHKLVPNARLIVVLRDPVDRAISAMNHAIRYRHLSPFAKADKVFSLAFDVDRDRFGLIGQGLYARNLERYLKVFPREQIRVLFFEDDIIKAPQDALAGIMQFLGGTAGSSPEKKRRSGNLLAGRQWWPENKRMHSRTGLILNYYAPAFAPLIAGVDRLLPEQPAISPTAECRERLYQYFLPHNRALFDLIGRSTSAWNAS